MTKALFVTGIALIAIVGCAQQPPPSPQGTLTQPRLGGQAGPTLVGGSASNTTTAFDGRYRGLSNRSTAATGGLKCQQFDEPPTMTIANGLAQFQALGVTFAGYVTPQGHLRMESGYGPTVEADFDPQTRTLQGRAVSVNCRYDVAWQKVA